MGNLESLRDKIQKFRIRNHEVAEAFKEIKKEAVSQEKILDDNLTDSLRKVFIKNELPGSDLKNAYKVALARTDGSGCTFGLCQFDVSVNSDARNFIEEHVEFPDPKYKEFFFSIRGKSLTYDGFGKPLAQDPFGHLRPEEIESIAIVNKALRNKKIKKALDELDNKQLNRIRVHVLTAFSNAIVLTRSIVLHLADMANQYGNFKLDGGTIKACEFWYNLNKLDRMHFENYPLKAGEEKADLLWAIHTCDAVLKEKKVSRESWEAFFLLFKLRTKHGRKHPYDPIRRWKNIVSVV